MATASYFRALMVLFGCAILAAQEPYGSLSGEVQDRLGAVVPHARVELQLETWPDHSSTQHADKNGEFYYSWLPAGIYSIKVVVTGFGGFTLKSVQVAQGERKRLPPIMLDSEPYQAAEYYELLPDAQHAGNLGGQVRQMEDGPPVSGAKVTLICGERKTCGETKTDSNGEFIFFNLRPGEYALRVTHVGFYPLDYANCQVREGLLQHYGPIQLEHCANGNCDPRLRPKRPLVVFQ